MQIFVKFVSNPSKLITLDEGAEWPGAKAEIIAKLAKQHVVVPGNIDVALYIGYQPVTAHTAFLNETTYELKPIVKPKAAVDQEVMSQLQIHLQGEILPPTPSHLIFISTGSNIHGNKGLSVAKEQQCPDDLIAHCAHNGLKLSLILLDLEFDDAHSDVKLYDHDPSWKLVNPQLGNHIKTFNQAGIGFQLFTYTSQLPDWGKQITHLASVDLNELGATLAPPGGQIIVRMYTGHICFNSNSSNVLGVYN